jgi:hypothetical protein
MSRVEIRTETDASAGRLQQQQVFAFRFIRMIADPTGQAARKAEEAR